MLAPLQTEYSFRFFSVPFHEKFHFEFNQFEKFCERSSIIFDGGGTTEKSPRTLRKKGTLRPLV